MKALLHFTPKHLRPSGQTGATLMEVLVALGIMSVAYSALMQAQSSAIRLSTYSKQITAASFLAQTKMEELEEKLTKDGFPDMDEEEEDNFEDMGYPNFKWKLEIKKVELPLASALDHLLSSMIGDTEEKKGLGGMLGGQLSGVESFLQGQFGDQLKSKLGSLGGNISSLLNPDMLKGQVDMLATMLEQAIREIRLTVFWEEGGPGKEMVVTTHLVQVPRAAAGAGALPGTVPGIQPPTGIAPPGLPTPGGSSIGLPQRGNLRFPGAKNVLPSK